MTATPTDRDLGTDARVPGRRNRGRWALLASTAVSVTGDGALIAAAPLMAAAITKDAFQVGLVSAAGYLAVGLFALPAGAVADRLDRRSIMVTADLARAVVLGLFGWLVAAGQANVPLLALTVFIVGVGSCFFDPATQAIIPDVIGRGQKDLTRLNGHLWAIDTFGRSLAGPPLGAVAFSATRSLPFVGDAISFVVSALLVRTLPKGAPGNGPHPPLGASVRSGAVYLAKHPRLRVLALGMASYNFSYNIGFATFVLYALHVLHLSGIQYGLILAAGAAGGVVSGWITPRLVANLSTEVVYAIAHTAQAAVWLTILATANAWTASVALAVLGATSTMLSVVGATARQVLAPAEMLGRVVATTRLLGIGSAGLGALAGGAIAQLVGLTAPFVLAAIVLLACAGLFVQAHRVAKTSS